MRQVLAALALILAIGLPAHPATAQGANPQQERMTLCNKQAGDQKLTGDARKTFMSNCLSGKTATEKPLTAQQQKMKDCNLAANAKDLKGDPRKAFMSSCLKGS